MCITQHIGRSLAEKAPKRGGRAFVGQTIPAGGGEVLEKGNAEALITDAAKTIFSYCRARTGTKEEAEDLSQDILLELLKSHGNISEDKAFYGFMWAVAGNVYKNWCRKRSKVAVTELDDRIPDKSAPLDDALIAGDDLQLLRRELNLLVEQHRKVTVMYYFSGSRVSEISNTLGISESMVKFLLFKSRQKLKEGMNMERTSGNLSFDPGNLQLRFWGSGSNPFWKLCEHNLIAQNILLACYNDRCTAEEISVQIGVAVPYLESDLHALCENKVLVRAGSRYETAIVIFTKDFAVEADAATLTLQQEIAYVLGRFFDKWIADIKGIGFYEGGNDDSLLKWHITAIALEKAVFKKYQGSLNIKYPTKYPGCEAFVWGEEDYKSRYGSFGTCALRNAEGDLIRFMDFSVNGEMNHRYFYDHPNRVNIMLDIAKGKQHSFSENDMLEIAEFIKQGYVKKIDDRLSLNIPVFTSNQFEELSHLLDDVTDEIAEITREMIKLSTEILIQHTPVQIKNEAKDISWLKMFDNAITAPVSEMLNNGILRKVAENEHPTAYVITKGVDLHSKPASGA